MSKTKEKYILLDLNGTVGTDNMPIFTSEYYNPCSILRVDRVEAYVNLNTLRMIKALSERYGATVLWVSLRGDDACILNPLVHVDWGYLPLDKPNLESFTFPKSPSIVDFAQKHRNARIILCDDMLTRGNAYSEIRDYAPNVDMVIPATSKGLTQDDLRQIEYLLMEED